MTEDEAKTKVCCGSPVVVGPILAAAFHSQSGSPVKADTKCVASDCMAWRWKEGLDKDPKDGHFKKLFGYCGLAGPP
jgi:hypothetical protein